ncbi:hypothetical protein ACO1O0_002364 [Amphichorda felina]
MAEPSEQTPPVDSAAQAEDTPRTEDAVSIDPSQDDDIKSKKVSLADLSAKGTALYAHRNYEEAAEVFSRASILQAEINGEIAPENAEILFHYGRSLFKVGQSKSDVLGGSAPTTDKKGAKANGQSKGSKPAQADEGKATKEDKESEEKAQGEDKKDATANKPLFQFTGDENFDDSDDDDGEDYDEAEQEEEDDDLATAFEVLDLARVCYEKLLEQLNQQDQNEKGKEVAESDSPTVRHVKERLADTHDALSEISLENERYLNAIDDGRTSLKYKMELYPEESEIIAEAHYKLSLALEFASVTTSSEDGSTAKREEMDQGLRDEAVKEMELAIKSFRLKLQNKEVEVATMASPEENDLTRKSIEEMKELIADMEQRLVDLRSDPIDTKGLMGADANPLGGILGAAMGESSAEAQARIEEASKKATDLTGLVRKKKPKNEAAPAESNGKRKAEDTPEDESSKRAKTEERTDAAA